MDNATLTGSEKQIAWAEKIRSKMLDSLTSYRAQYLNLAEGNVTPDMVEMHELNLTLFLECEAGIRAQSSAKWLIDNRDLPVTSSGGNSLIKSVVPDADDRIRPVKQRALSSQITECQAKIAQCKADLEKEAQIAQDAAKQKAQYWDEHKSEYDALQAIADSWTDEQVEGKWTTEMLENAKRRQSLEDAGSKYEQARFNATQNCRALEATINKLEQQVKTYQG